MTDNSSIVVAIEDEDGLNRMIRNLRSQRPSLFNSLGGGIDVDLARS